LQRIVFLAAWHGSTICESPPTATRKFNESSSLSFYHILGWLWTHAHCSSGAHRDGIASESDFSFCTDRDFFEDSCRFWIPASADYFWPLVPISSISLCSAKIGCRSPECQQIKKIWLLTRISHYRTRNSFFPFKWLRILWDQFMLGQFSSILLAWHYPLWYILSLYSWRNERFSYPLETDNKSQGFM
jgi:hypothetical protein